VTGWTEQVLATEATFRRAPSAHNTQPATLFADGETLVGGWDPARELLVADPTRRDLWLSLGAFVESVRIAAADAGLGVGVVWDVDARAHRVARLVETDARPLPGGFTAEDLRARRTARGPYTEPFAGAATVGDVGVGAALGDQARLSVVARALIDELLPVADRWSYGSPAQVAELRRWLRLDAGDPRYRVDGLTDEALALTPVQARLVKTALSPRVWPALRRLGGPSLLASASRISGRGPVVALHVAATDTQSPHRVCAHGGALLRTWLAAQRQGLHVHPLSQLVDCPATAVTLHEAVSVPDDDRQILSIFRIGRPAGQPVESARTTGSRQVWA